MEISHEQYFFDNGDNVGYFAEGVSRDGYSKQEYKTCDGANYNDDLVREAIPFVTDSSASDYNPYFNNCQDWADRLRDQTWGAAKDKAGLYMM